MKTNERQDDCGIFGYEGRDFLRLWGGLVQGVFPFMMNEVSELTDKNRLFVVVCESTVKPEEFEYARWKGIGRPPVDHMAVFKALLFKAVHDIPTTKELVERLKLEPQSRRLCGWLWPEDVPCESKFSEVNAEFAERGFTEEWFDAFVRRFVGVEGRKSVCYDSAPVPVRAKAANRRRGTADLEPDQPEAGDALNGRPGRTRTRRLRNFRRTATGGRSGTRTASRSTGKAARSTPPSPTTESPWPSRTPPRRFTTRRRSYP